MAFGLVSDDAAAERGEFFKKNSCFLLCCLSCSDSLCSCSLLYEHSASRFLSFVFLTSFEVLHIHHTHSKILEKFYSKDLFDENLNIYFLGVSIYLSYASYLIRRTFRLSCICNLNIILTSHSFPMRPLRSLLVHALVSPLSPGSRRPLPYATPAHSLQLASCCVSALYDHVKRPISFWCLRVCLRLFRFSCCFPASDP